MNWSVRLGCACVGLCLAGCVTGTTPLTEARREAIRVRAERVFDRAVLFKPPEVSVSESPGPKFAPLFVQEIAAAQTTVAGNVSPPEVQYVEGECLLAGRSHRQISYSWRNWSAEPQGFCITLNSDGLPMFWEVLKSPPGERVFFVSQKLETAALRRFGVPMPGRRFAVERAGNDAARIVVAKVLEDAPVAMGPIVHLDAHGDIATINCRCMATQARQLVATAYYPLKAAAGCSKVEAPATNGSLVDQLRLPSDF